MAKAQLLIHHQQRQLKTSLHTHAHPKLIAEFNRNGGEFIIVINKEQEEIQLTPAQLVVPIPIYQCDPINSQES